jgi:hypothetical protein
MFFLVRAGFDFLMGKEKLGVSIWVGECSNLPNNLAQIVVSCDFGTRSCLSQPHDVKGDVFRTVKIEEALSANKVQQK